MAKVVLFASNLYNPSHMEWTSAGRLYVNEHSAGRIKDITSGGNMRDSQSIATGLRGPAGILPLKDGKILVAETWGGRIKDISAGGDMSAVAPFADGLSMPYSMVIARKSGNEGLFVSECQNYRSSWITDVTRGGSRPNHNFYVLGLPTIPGTPGVTPVSLTNWGEEWVDYSAGQYVRLWQEASVSGGSEHYVAVGALGQILDISGQGGQYHELVNSDKIVAWGLNRIGGIKLHPSNGLLYVTEPETGSVVAVDVGKPSNYKFTAPVVRGLTRPTCLRFSPDGKEMYVCGQGEGVIWKITEF